MGADSAGHVIRLFSQMTLLDIKQSLTRSERPGGHFGTNSESHEKVIKRQVMQILIPAQPVNLWLSKHFLHLPAPQLLYF